MPDRPAPDLAYHMRLLVDHVPSMLAYWDRDLLCRFANRAYTTWFGADPDKLIGTSIRDLLGPKLYALNEAHILGALRGEEQLFERIVPGPDGVNRHSLAHYIPDVAGGVVRGFMVQVTEVTQLKEVQAALRQEQALRAQAEAHTRKLQALLSERSEMLDVLAHEVRQPLNNASAALQSATAALRASGETLGTASLTRAQTVMSQVLANIDNTLAVASLLARQESAERLDTDVDTLLSVVIADMPASERSRIHVERLTATRTASMDMGLMRLAMRNLLSNALKFSPPQAPVHLRLLDSDEPLALVIEVSDTGGGLEPQVAQRVFERGVRGSGESSGHGLGLYIVRRVMELHGGHVELTKSDATGTTMRLVIVQATHD